MSLHPLVIPSEVEESLASREQRDAGPIIVTLSEAETSLTILGRASAIFRR